MIGLSKAPDKSLRVVVLTIFIVASLLFTSPANSDHSEAIEENALKAAFLHYFFQLIRWPIERDSQSIEFCFLGENSVITSLREIVLLKKSKSLSIDFSLISTAKEAIGCDYVFIDSHSRSFALPVIYTTRGRPILTVSEVEGFAQAGGVIELKRENTRIAVSINVDALEMQGLNASSRLLSLAERVSTKGGSREDHAVAD